MTGHTSKPVFFLDRNQTCIGSFLPFMDTGPLCSKWNCESEFSRDMRHLKDRTWSRQGELIKAVERIQTTRSHSAGVVKGA